MADGVLCSKQFCPVSGPGLAFIVYPRAVSMMPFPPLWACCFFIMIILLGLDSHFVCVESLTTSVVDMYPSIFRQKNRRELLILAVAVVSYLIGLVMLTEGTFAFFISKYSPLKYNNVYVYPWWGYVLGWFLALSSMGCVPLWIIYRICTTKGTLRERILHLTKPSIDLPKTNKEKDKLLAIFDPSCDGHPQQAPPPKDSHLQVSMTELYH
ncbi:hypothetical protein SKAU_G00035470 [Synaphobranchus kaupii]|uniref:Uncharacterized protein n=1 Tax=Synaphobranchus kaupii TaxID=118154 RepID=A0A9Q1JGV9_SYNKA|nr:hypothetical protein SKAU_G00035470 [Synaphobranchus kaupii]